MSETTYTFYPDSSFTLVVPPPDCDIYAGIKPLTPLDVLGEAIEHVDTETPFTVADVSSEIVYDPELADELHGRGNTFVHLGRTVIRLGWKEPVDITFDNENLLMRDWNALHFWLAQQPHLLNDVVNTARKSLGRKESVEPYYHTGQSSLDYVLDSKGKPSVGFVKYASVHELTAYVAGAARNNESSEHDGQYHVHRYGFTPIYLPVKTHHREDVLIELPHPSLAKVA